MRTVDDLDRAPDGRDENAATPPLSETEALRHLYLVQRPALMAYTLRLTGGDLHWAEDIVQETMMRAWRRFDARNERGQWNRVWLFTIARRVVIDHVRAAKARPVDYTDERIDVEGDDTEEKVHREFDSHAVREAVKVLPDRLRTTLEYLYFEERSIAETAALLNIPPGTVKSRSHHALRALRHELVSRGFEAPPTKRK